MSRSNPRTESASRYVADFSPNSRSNSVSPVLARSHVSRPEPRSSSVTAPWWNVRLRRPASIMSADSASLTTTAASKSLVLHASSRSIRPRSDVVSVPPTIAPRALLPNAARMTAVHVGLSATARTARRVTWRAYAVLAAENGSVPRWVRRASPRGLGGGRLVVDPAALLVDEPVRVQDLESALIDLV